MADIVSQPWFWPAVIVSVGLPLVLIGLTEMHNALARRGSRAAPIVADGAQLPRAGRGRPGAHHAAGRLAGRRAPGRRSSATIFGLLVIVVIDQRDQPPRLPPRREGVVARPVPDDLQRPDPVRLHHRRHRAAVLVGVGCRCRRRLRRARHHLDRRRPRAAERGRIDRVGPVPDLRGAVPARRLDRDRRQRAGRSSR